MPRTTLEDHLTTGANVMGWIDRLAKALGEEPPSEVEAARLLDAAREVAHRVERKATPLAAYLLGAAAGRRIAAGENPEAAARAVLQTLASVLPPAPSES